MRDYSYKTNENKNANIANQNGRHGEWVRRLDVYGQGHTFRVKEFLVHVTAPLHE